MVSAAFCTPATFEICAYSFPGTFTKLWKLPSAGVNDSLDFFLWLL